MILGVNGRFLGARPTGVQRFAREITRRLWVGVEEGVLFLPADVPAPADLPEHVRVVRGRLAGHPWERIELPRLARAAGCDVTLHPANTAPRGGGPNVVVVHDVEPLIRPEAFAPLFAAWYRHGVAPAVRRAARVLTVSSASAEAIALVLSIDRDRIDVADQGAAPLDARATSEAVERVRARFALRGPYLLAVGGGDPRKNLAFVSAVVERWRERRARNEWLPSVPTLVTVGGGDRRIFAAGADATGPSSTGLRLGPVDDETLRALYTGALALAFPSLGEGFGRPPLEAMACGTVAMVAPYLAASEVVGDAADTVPLDVDRWVAALAGLLMEGEDVRRRRLERGMQQAARHSWDAGAEAVLRSCEAVASGRDRPSPARTGVRVVSDAGPEVAAAATLDLAQPSTPFGELRVAVVHDWLVGMRGGEKVLEALLELVPNADLFTLLHVPGSVSEAIEARRIETSFIQRLPQAARRYRSYLPLFPRAIESFDLSGYDLVLSSSHCVAKGVRPRGAPHLCYCHTPVRYVWDQRDAYLAPGRANPLVRALAPRMLDRLRHWDVSTSSRVDRFVANSENVRGRIWRCWAREAGVVYPPVAVERFDPLVRREGFYLVVSALVPYKRLEITIDACRQLGRELVIVGSGPDLTRLRARAGEDAGVRFTGWLPDEEVADLMQRCRALIMPGVEDFGIVPVEAQAAGAPVIALASGGALETVVDSPDDAFATGVFFAEPTPSALVEALRTFEERSFDPDVARANALRFGRAHFLRRMTIEIESLLSRAPVDPVRPV